MRDKERKMQLI